MDTGKLRQAWLDNFSTAEEQLNKMKQVRGLVSAFNANIDAVIKVSGRQIEQLLADLGLQPEDVSATGVRNIEKPADVFRGLIHCFKGGIAEEWLINEVSVFQWLQNHLGYDKLQMGGQGGIVANVMAVCGVNPVYVHCASLPDEQAGLFLDLDNLLSTNEEGQLTKARNISRKEDLPLIHWIIEFDVKDQLHLGDQLITCPKSNRFIATFDPLNFKLHIDPHFARAVSNPDNHLDYVILSGYQMLQADLGGGLSGSDRIDESISLFQEWKKNHPAAIFHLEMASTQDRVMRKYLLDHLAPKVDSLGFNERELIDLLEVINENELAEACNQSTHAGNLFKAMLKVQAYTGCERLQLHMFGLYLTVQKPGFRISPMKNRKGMQLAATIAAAKAGTGAINDYDVLLWAKGRTVSEVGLNEMQALAADIAADNPEDFLTTGLSTHQNLDVIAVPTILIEKPITLVGMGDTISSISLVASI